MEAADRYEFKLTAEEATYYTNLKPDLSMVLQIPMNASDGLACLGGGLFQMGDLLKSKKKDLDYTHSQRAVCWRGALSYVEFHPKSEATTAQQCAPGVVLKVVDMSKVGGGTGGEKGVFLGVISPPYKNAQGHFRANACILVDVRTDPIKMLTNNIPEKALKDLNGLIQILPEFSGLGIQSVQGVAQVFDQPCKKRFEAVERAVINSAKRAVNGTRHDQRKDSKKRLEDCFVPILHWYKENQIKLYRPLKNTVTFIDPGDNASSSKIVLQVSIAVMHIHSVHKLLLHKMGVVHNFYAILHKIYALHTFCVMWHGCGSIDGGV
jgi:hypothetical protein